MMATPSQASVRRNRELYFHIQKKNEVVLKECTEDKRFLPRLRNQRQRLAYFKSECTHSRVHRGSTYNDEERIKSEKVKENLKSLLTAVSNESSVEGIRFQARFGSMYFILPHDLDNQIVDTSSLKKDSVRKRFLFRVSFDPQYFIQEHCIASSVEPLVRYKVKFILYTADGTTMEIGCHMEEKDDRKFELKWARIDGIANPSDHWNDVKTKLDIVRPGRKVDMRIVTLLQTPECKSGDAPYDVAAEIAESMTHEPSGKLSMQVAGDNYYVCSIRKKTTKAYNWLDPDDMIHDWSIIECYANNTKENMEEEYRSMRENQQFEPVFVDFSDQTINEIYFNGSFHIIRPNEDPDVKVSTPEQVLTNFEQFVSVSFRNAELLDDIHHAHAPH